MKLINAAAFFIITGLFQTGLYAQSYCCDMPGWTHSKNIVIDNSNYSSSLIDYQVNIHINTQTLVNQAKMNADGSDIRFLDNSCNELYYWIENGMNSTSTSIWVKIKSIPASTVDTIYMYYGDTSATAVSNGDSTFVFFDDFNDNSIGSSWTIQVNTWSEFGGVLRSAGNGSTTYPKIYTNSFSINNAIWNYKYRWTSTPGSNAGAWHAAGPGVSLSNSYGYHMRNTNEYKFVSTSNDFLNTSALITSSWPHDTLWHEHRIVRDQAANWNALLDGNSIGTFQDTTYSNFGIWKFRGPSDGWTYNGGVEIDDFYVAKYVSPNPKYLEGDERMHSHIGPVACAFDYVQNGRTVNFYNTTANGNTFFWDFDDGTTDTVSDPIHTFIGYGKFVVCLKTSNECWTDTCCKTLTFVDIGVKEENEISKVNIYPNPVKSELAIELNKSYSQIEVSIQDIKGRALVKEIHFDRDRIRTSIGGPPGIYFIKIQTEDGVWVEKVVKE